MGCRSSRGASHWKFHGTVVAMGHPIGHPMGLRTGFRMGGPMESHGISYGTSYGVPDGTFHSNPVKHAMVYPMGLSMNIFLGCHAYGSSHRVSGFQWEALKHGSLLRRHLPRSGALGFFNRFIVTLSFIELPKTLSKCRTCFGSIVSPFYRTIHGGLHRGGLTPA